MEKEIEILKLKLDKLVEGVNCLYSDEVVKLSQELDMLIYKYYLATTAV